jgi:hypothetical protein
MTASINYFGIQPALTVYEDRMDGSDRTAYTVYGHDEALAFARVLVNNGSAVEIIPVSSVVPSVEEFEEIERDFGEDDEVEKCPDPNCCGHDDGPQENISKKLAYEDVTAHDLLETTDGRVWAEKFIETIEDWDTDPTDLDWVTGWFANAIETGRRFG